MTHKVAHGIYSISDCLSVAECLSYIAESETIGYEAATIATRKGSVRDERIRNNSRIVRDDPVLAAILWSRIGPNLPRFFAGRQAIGINECFRFYRYEVGQQFAGHTDGSFRRENGVESRLTVLIYLNDNFTGGETAFQDLVVTPRQGMALVFRHELFHEAKPVTRDKKYVLRSDVMFNPVGRISA